jgi:hypothetical protein
MLDGTGRAGAAIAEEGRRLAGLGEGPAAYFFRSAQISGAISLGGGGRLFTHMARPFGP